MKFIEVETKHNTYLFNVNSISYISDNFEGSRLCIDDNIYVVLMPFTELKALILNSEVLPTK